MTSGKKLKMMSDIGDLFPLKDTRIERADIDEETE